MPEGHTLHRLAKDHTKWFVGQKLKVSSPQARFAEESEVLSGKKLVAAEAYGKHLVYRFGRSQIMHVHLGLYGKFRTHKLPVPEPRGAVRVRMIGDDRAFDLNGPNRCELLGKEAFESLLDRLGPDPLRKDADAEKAWRKISRSSSTIGALLLNQSVIAGIGNIYRSEILYQLHIHPNRRGKEIDRKEFDDLWDLSVKWMQIGVKYNRIICIDPDDAPRALGRLTAKERLQIYKRATCSGCGSDIECWESANRKIFACLRCQA